MLIDANGGNPRAVTRNGAVNLAPTWHPDGRQILFASNFESESGVSFDLYLINRDGTGLVRVSFEPTFDGMPSFSPNGEKLTWTSGRNDLGHAKANVFVGTWRD